MIYKSYVPGMKSIPLQTPAQLAAHLRSFRKARGLTQAQLGHMVGLDQSRITRIEHHPERVSVHTILQLLAALRVRVLFEPLAARNTSDNPPGEW